MESRKHRIKVQKSSRSKQNQKKLTLDNWLNTKEILRVSNNYFLFFESFPKVFKEWKKKRKERKKRNKAFRFINAFVVIFILFVVIYSSGLLYFTNH